MDIGVHSANDDLVILQFLARAWRSENVEVDR